MLEYCVLAAFKFSLNGYAFAAIVRLVFTAMLAPKGINNWCGLERRVKLLRLLLLSVALIRLTAELGFHASATLIEIFVLLSKRFDVG